MSHPTPEELSEMRSKVTETIAIAKTPFQLAIALFLVSATIAFFIVVDAIKSAKWRTGSVVAAGLVVAAFALLDQGTAWQIILSAGLMFAAWVLASIVDESNAE